MRVLGPDEVTAALDFPGLIEALRGMLRGRDVVTAPRRRYTIAVPAAGDGLLVVAPAWQEGRHLGIELTTVFPDDAPREGDAHPGSYLLLDGRTGRPLALLDAPALSARRTAATSALAATYLARSGCERLLMIGTGPLVSHLIEAHASVRPIRTVLVWDRDVDKAVHLAQRLTRRTLTVAATDNLQRALAGAHVICCALAARQPVLRGHWLPLGAHIDLVLGEDAEGRATDAATLRRASVFLDAREPAFATVADRAVPVAADVMAADHVMGDLSELARGSRVGRRFADEITLFRSRGLSFLDLAAATLALANSVN
jgi:alanine dehydrogenase